MATTRLLSAMVATWNNVATTFTGLKLNVTDTASAAGSLLMDLQVDGSTKFNVDKSGVVLAGSGAVANPTYSFSADPNTGIYNSSADVLDITTAGVARWRVNGNGHLLAATTNAFDIGATGGVNQPRNAFLAGSAAANNGVAIGSIGTLRFSSTTDAGASADLFLWRDAANTLALRNGTAGNTLRVYDSYTDASNGQWALLGSDAGTSYLATQKNGTGGVMPLQIQVGNTNIWQFTAAGNFVASTDNTYDIGASGANRPRRGYFSGFVVTQSTTVAGLTAAATAGAGARSFVTDLNVTAVGNFGQPAVGGGANKGPVYSDGASWLIG